MEHLREVQVDLFVEKKLTKPEVLELPRLGKKLLILRGCLGLSGSMHQAAR